MATHQTPHESDDSTDGTALEGIDRNGLILLEQLGEATLHVDVEPETYRRLREAYDELVERGYSEPFDVFAVNHLRIAEPHLTVDGVTVDPDEPVESALEAASDEEVVDLATVSGDAVPEVSDR